MREHGFVEEVYANRARIRVAKMSACGENCASCGGCTPGERVIEVKNNIGAKAGDRVIAELESGRVLSAAFLAYILPLAVFVAVYLLCPESLGGEGTKILLSAAGALAVFFVIYLFQKRNGEKYMPEIVGIIKDNQKDGQ